MKLPKLSRRVLLVLALIAIVPVVLITAAVVVLESEWAERRIEHFASERLNRDVLLNEIDLRFAWPPRIHLQSLRVSNPEWATTEHLIEAEDLAASVQFWPLFRGQVVIEELVVARGRAGLEQDGKRATWRFGRNDDEPSRFHLQEARLGDAWIYYGNQPHHTALHIHASGELGPRGGSMAAVAKGTFRGEPAHGSMKTPSLLVSADRPTALTFEVTVGQTSGTFDGTIQAGTDQIQSIDGDVSVRGQTLEHLFDLFGVNLPETPPYRLEGHLRHASKRWSVEPISGEIGDSDLGGSFSFDTSGKKPMLKADLTSERLDFDDLGPLVGAPPAAGQGETASAQQKRAARARTQKSDVLPEAKFETHRWGDMNADVRLKALRVDARPELPINSLRTHLTLQDAVLRVQPLTLQIAGGHIEANVSVHANQSPVKGELDVQVRALDLSRLFPKLESMRGSLGKLYGNAHLTGRGRSVEGLLASADGELTAAVTGGRIAALLIEAAGLDLAEALAVISSKNVQTPLRCAVADFAIDSGVARAKAFVIDTRDTIVRVEGTISLAAEKYDLVVHPHPKDASAFSLRSPLLVTGRLGDPDVRLKVAPIASRIGAAALLALVNPLLAFLPFIDPGTDDHANCSALLDRAKGAQPNQ